MAKKFEVGAKVMLKKSSEYYAEDSDCNPRDVEGEITRNDGSDEGDHPYYVTWDNGQTNVYNAVDLKRAKKKKAPSEDLLAEIIYKDECGDFVEVDTEMRGNVYFRTGQMDGDDPEFDRTIVLSEKQVKKIRKQLKAWLDKQVSAA